MEPPDANSLREATPEEPLVIGDVSGCGSGRLIVDSAHRFRDLAPETPAVYLGSHKDPLCAKMAVLNFVLNDMTGYVLLGDALKLDARRVWFISTSQLVRGDHPVRELSSDERDHVLAWFFGVPLADALATTLAALTLAEARELASEWEGLEALIIHDGVFHTTDGFETHVLDT